MNSTHEFAVPAASAAALRAALDGVGHAEATAWAVGLAVLADAAGNGRIAQTNGLPGAAHSRVTSGLGTAGIVPGTIGDRVTLKLHVTPLAYERIRGHLREDCLHDEECECDPNPWPALEKLPRDVAVPILDIEGMPRGLANRSPHGLGPVALNLDDENIFTAAEVLRIAATPADQIARGASPQR